MSPAYIPPVNGWVICDVVCHRNRTNGLINGIDITDFMISGRNIVTTRFVKEVLFAGSAGTAGNMVECDLGDEWGISRDLHMSSVAVRAGMRNLPQGTIIGQVGSTGSSTGPHDHTEIRFKTQAAAERIAQGYPVYFDANPWGFYIDPQVAWRFQTSLPSPLPPTSPPIISPPTIPVTRRKDMRVFVTVRHSDGLPQPPDGGHYYVVGAGYKRHIDDGQELDMMLRAAGQSGEGPEKCYLEQMNNVPTLAEAIKLGV